MPKSCQGNGKETSIESPGISRIRSNCGIALPRLNGMEIVRKKVR
jgi:hypothetical protein